MKRLPPLPKPRRPKAKRPPEPWPPKWADLPNLDTLEELSRGELPTPEPAAPDDSTTQARYVGPVVLFPVGGALAALPAKDPQ